MELKDLSHKKDKFTLRYIEKLPARGLFARISGKQENQIRTGYLYRTKIKVGEIAENTSLIEDIISLDVSDGSAAISLKLKIVDFLFQYFSYENEWLKRDHLLTCDYEQLLSILGGIIEDLKKKAKKAKKLKAVGGDSTKR